MIGKYNKSVILTYIGVACATFGMVLAMDGAVVWAMICLIISGICDLFDGVIARKCKRNEEEKEFGVQIDSLADMISFIAFPCVLGMQLMKNISYALIPILVFYTLCGIIRLAWFNMHTNSEGNMTHYDGLPVTYVALILSIYYLFEGLLPQNVYGWLTAVVYCVIAVCFILKIKIRKPRGVWYIIFGVLAIVVTVGLIIKGTML